MKFKADKVEGVLGNDIGLSTSFCVVSVRSSSSLLEFGDEEVDSVVEMVETVVSGDDVINNSISGLDVGSDVLVVVAVVVGISVAIMAANVVEDGGMGSSVDTVVVCSIVVVGVEVTGNGVVDGVSGDGEDFRLGEV